METSTARRRGGGASGQGTVYKFDPTTGTLTTVHSFSGTDGSGPWVGLVQASDGNLYGTTSGGGDFSQGTVYKLDPTTGTLTTVHSFSRTDSSVPFAGLVQAADGDLYGTTILGGSGDAGTVYRLGISPRFVRGDVNGNGSVELADSVLELEYLFSHRVQLGCLDAADVNDDGKLGLADPIHILKALFSGHFSIPGPYPGCGPDPTHDLLGCESYTGCQ